MRKFDPRVEQFAADWRATPSTSEPWQLRPDLGKLTGAASSYWVSSPLTVGVAKPLKPGPVPFAALEKIASDLAFDLELPVPPVTLWDRSPQQNGECQYVAVSSVPFPQPREWGKIHGDPTLAAIAATIRQKLSAPASAMCAFDTWLHNTDHNNHPANLLVSLATDPEQTLYVAYIDYSYSMAHSWPGKEWAGHYCPKVYDPQVAPDLGTIRATVDRIQNLSETHIREVVERVPDQFITPAQKTNVGDGLADRKHRLNDILRAHYQI